MTRDDLRMLAGWLAEPHVERFWREPSDIAHVEARYRPSIDGDDPTDLLVLQAGGQDIGMFQRYRIADNPDWLEALRRTPAEQPETAAGIDYLIGVAAMTGSGLGTAAVGAFTSDTLMRYPDVDRILVTVDVENRPSWRVLERNGYIRRWTGEIRSSDPSDEGISHLYELRRRGRLSVSARR